MSQEEDAPKHQNPHQHDHDHGGHSHYPDSAVSRLLDKVGLISLATRLEHSGICTLVSIASFALSLMLGSDLAARVLGSMAAHAAHMAALAVTFVLSGLPQTVEAACVAGSGRLDTHVLMSLAVVGTLTLGMAQEVRG